MFAHRQIYDDLPPTLSVPTDLQHKKTEVIYIVLTSDAESAHDTHVTAPTLASFAGSWAGDLVRAPQGNYETRQDWQ